MPIPAARVRRIMWIAVALAMLAVHARVVTLAQDAPTQTPTPIAYNSGSVAAPPAAAAAAAATMDCPAPGSLSSVAPEDEPITDYAIVLDVSRSMKGDYLLADGLSYGNDPTRNIFPLVQSAVVGYIQSLKPQANIILIPFAEKVPKDAIVMVDGQRDTSTQEAIDAVNAAVADGTGTFITQAVNRATDELEALQRTTPSETRYQTILLFTDGEGTGTEDLIAGTPTVDAMLQRLEAYRTEQPFLFVKYVALGFEVPNAAELRQAGVTVVEEPTGRVTPIREIGLTLLGRDFGAVVPGQEIVTRLCVTGGASIAELPVSLSVGGVNGQIPPVKLQTVSALVSAAGADVRWRIPDDGRAQPGDYVGYLEIRDEDPELLLLPERLPVEFTIGAPTPTPSPTATPSPSATPSPTPTETPTPVPGVAISLGSGSGKQKVSLGDPSDKPVRWTIPVEIQPTPGARPELVLTPPSAATGYFEVNGNNSGSRIQAGGDKVQIVIETTAGALQAGGENDPATLDGGVGIDPRGAAVSLPSGPCQPNANCDLPFAAEAKVYEPVNWTPILLGLLALLLAGGAGAVVWAARPVLPKHAAVMTGSGRRITSLPLGDHQSGFLPKPVSIGGNGSNVNVGAGAQIGEVHGRWGMPHRAFLTVDGSASGVRVDNQAVEPGATAQLGEGSQVKMGNRTFRYSQESPS